MTAGRSMMEMIFTVPTHRGIRGVLGPLGARGARATLERSLVDDLIDLREQRW